MIVRRWHVKHQLRWLYLLVKVKELHRGEHSVRLAVRGVGVPLVIGQLQGLIHDQVL